MYHSDCNILLQWRFGMEAYSINLRQRIIRECDCGTDTREEIADRFDVSTSFIRKLLQRRRGGQSIVPKPHRGGRASSLSDQDLQQVWKLVKDKPDATLRELSQKLVEAGGSQVRSWTMCRALQRLGLPRKKRLFMPVNETRRVFRNCVGNGWTRCGDSLWNPWFLWTKAARPLA
jgi:transposase